MSRVGELPIPVPENVSIDLKKGQLNIKGPKGDLSQDIPVEVKVTQNENEILVQPTGDTKKHRSFHGLFRALINNMVVGVSEGFKRDLEIQGVGYTAALNGKNLVLNLGYSHPILFKPPGEVDLEVPSRTEISVKGISKQLVGEIAAKIRSFRPPEPYKGKGIRYLGEEVKHKVGKTAGAVA